MPTTSRATASGPTSVGVLPNARMTKTSTKVPITSVTTFQPGERIVGHRAEDAELGASSASGSSKCFL